MASAEDQFGELLGGLDYPIFVVTTIADGEKSGCLVGFTTQVSINPPLFLVGLSEKNHTVGVAGRATHLAVHFIDRGHLELAHLFGEESGDEVDKFSACQWSTGPHGVPVLDDASAWFVGRIAERIDLGDHISHLLEPADVKQLRSIETMISYRDVKDFDAGHEA